MVRKRLRFWSRNKQAATLEADTVDALQLMAQTLKQEASIAGNSMPVMVLEGAEEKKNRVAKVLSKLLVPKSMIAYSIKEAF